MGVPPTAQALEPPTSGPSLSCDPSVTEVGDPALIRASSLNIARGAVLAGRYQIEAVIGKGGSGIVLRAFDRVAQVPVAIKILKPDLAADPRWIERFSRELRLARQIQHANVCRVFDIGQADGHWFITMELATGGTLRDQLGQQATERTVAEKRSDIRAVAAGLAAIHAAGIVHRDVKPDNFLRMADGRLVLSDFGLATNPADAPAVSIMVGTPHYMAPEVVMGDAATARSDVWAASIVIHEILVGTRPERKSVTRAPTVQVKRDASRSTKALLAVCQMGLREEPSDRPRDGIALATLADAAIASRLRIRSRSGQTLLWGLTTVATLSLAGILGKHLWRPAKATSSSPAPSGKDISITGSPRDLSRSSAVFATFDQHVHCFAVLPGSERARVIWGDPRRAEDIDIASGKRTSAALAPETYQTDCPQVSPKGDSLLFTRLSATASPQIMHSGPEGLAATAVTNGSEPRWLPNGEEFLYNIDAGHAGVFSLPTLESTMFSDDRGQATRSLYKKAVSNDGSTVAIAYHVDATNRLLEIHSLPDMNVLASWRIPLSVRGIGFDRNGLSLSDVSQAGTLDLLNWRSGEAQRSGYLPMQNVESLIDFGGDRSVLVASRKTSDVWLFNGVTTARQLTYDGRNYGAAWSPKGDVLVSKELGDNRLVIFRYDRDGTSRQVSAGPLDATPSFSQDGELWTYADYHRRAIVLCDAAGCKNVWSEKLPAWPTISPDRKHIAFIDQGGMNHLRVINMDGSSKRDLVPLNVECPPIWTSATSLWGLSGSGNDRTWQEIDLGTGNRTGRSKLAVAADPDAPICGAQSEPAGSPFFQHTRIISRETWEARSIPNLSVN
ncbi:MAG TPA: protein kinase [Polyangia bacterium]|jgi:serine/threonine protein kinase|nr:protein kinase [Polyangia bacterium]